MAGENWVCSRRENPCNRYQQKAAEEHAGALYHFAGKVSRNYKIYYLGIYIFLVYVEIEISNTHLLTSHQTRELRDRKEGLGVLCPGN